MTDPIEAAACKALAEHDRPPMGLAIALDWAWANEDADRILAAEGLSPATEIDLRDSIAAALKLAEIRGRKARAGELAAATTAPAPEPRTWTCLDDNGNELTLTEPTAEAAALEFALTFYEDGDNLPDSLIVEVQADDGAITICRLRLAISWEMDRS